MKKTKTAPPNVPFSPYVASEHHGVLRSRGGINWTWVWFPTKKAMDEFERDCRENGYRCRTQGKDGKMDDGTWGTQYHHYQD
jgi:hypothetical protein